MIKPEWHFMLDQKKMKAPKKYSIEQRLKRIEKAIGEIYISIHHIVNKIEPKEKSKKENE